MATLDTRDIDRDRPDGNVASAQVHERTVSNPIAVEMLEPGAQPANAITARPMRRGGPGPVGHSSFDRTDADFPTAKSPEYDLWEAAINQAILDALGTTAGSRKSQCHQCHVLDPCDCDWVPVTRPKIVDDKVFFNRKNRQGNWYQHFCALEDADGLLKRFKGKLYFKTLSTMCKSTHTVQQCAIRWFTSDDCRAKLAMLGIDREWFLGQIKQKGIPINV